MFILEYLRILWKADMFPCIIIFGPLNEIRKYWSKK